MDSTLAFVSKNFEFSSAYFQRISVASKSERGTDSVYSSREFVKSRGEEYWLQRKLKTDGFITEVSSDPLCNLLEMLFYAGLVREQERNIS
jgi:hypothetical protein